MRRSAPSRRRSKFRYITAAVGTLWLPLLVFAAFDLSVADDLSVIKQWLNAQPTEEVPFDGRYVGGPVAPTGDVEQGDHSPHVYFGIDESMLAGDAAETASAAIGEWSGRFAGILSGDEEESCWSAYDFDIHLRESGDEVTGSGSYWVDPASCSLHAEKFIAFVDARGTRRGSQLTLDIRSGSDGALELVFDGLMLPGRLAGWFYSPDGKPVSGPVVLARK